MPEIDIVGAGACDDTPDDVGGEVLGDIERHRRTDGIDQRVDVHLPVEKPEEGLKDERRPVPGQGEFRPGRPGEFLEGLQIAVGIGADEGFPELRIRLRRRCRVGFHHCFPAFNGEGAAALVAKAGIVPVLLPAL